MKQVLYNETTSPVQLRCRWVCAQPNYQRCRSSGKQSIEGILRRHGHLRNHQSERGWQPRRPKNDATSFLGSKRRPGAPVSRMKQRGRSMPCDPSNCLLKFLLTERILRLKPANSVELMAAHTWHHFSKYCQQVECYHVKVTCCHFEN